VEVQFARANALSAYKSSNLKDIGRSVQQVVTLQEEIQLHIDFCKGYGLSEADIINEEEDQATTAYTRYVLDIGMSQDYLALQIALLPCLIGYGIIAKRLYEDPSTVRVGSKYWKWIEQYVAEEYREAMMRGSELVERHAEGLSPSRVEELAGIFIHATNVSILMEMIDDGLLMLQRWREASGTWASELARKESEYGRTCDAAGGCTRRMQS
jgi:ATP-dependent RNA helicase DDX5/DBP2